MKMFTQLSVAANGANRTAAATASWRKENVP